MTWPPANYPYPHGGPSPRTLTSPMSPWHADDHNDTNTALNELVDRVNVYDRIVFNNTASGLVTLDLNVARFFAVKLTGNISGFNVTNFQTTSGSGVGANTFTLLVNTGTTGGFSINWDLKISSVSQIPKWPNAAPPTLAMEANKDHVLSFHWSGLYWFGYVNAEDMG